MRKEETIPENVKFIFPFDMPCACRHVDGGKERNNNNSFWIYFYMCTNNVCYTVKLYKIVEKHSRRASLWWYFLYEVLYTLHVPCPIVFILDNSRLYYTWCVKYVYWIMNVHTYIDIYSIVVFFIHALDELWFSSGVSHYTYSNNWKNITILIMIFLHF